MELDYLTLFFVGGIILLILDLMFININVLVFLGLGAIISSGLMSFGFEFPSNSLLINLITYTGIFSALLVSLLWKPLLKYQNTTQSDSSSDIIGKTLVVKEKITLKNNGKVRFSGVDWTSKADPEFVTEEILNVNNEVIVTKITGNILWVKPI